MDVDGVKRNIQEIYNRRRAAVYALCLSYAARALNKFRQDQQGERFWKNQTGQAMARVFSNATMEDNVVSWFMAHGVQYGVYLELANDRKHEALRPIIQEFIEPFMKDLKELYA
jgi:hypothetical protein